MTLKSMAAIVLLCSATAAAQRAASSSSSSDWTQWRGPNRDGSAPSFVVPKVWPDQLTRQWTTEVGLGYATPLVAGDRVFLFTRQSDEEVVRALDAKSGKEIWSTRYAAPYVLVASAAAHGMGPKATPVLADGKLFTFGISGILSAFDASTGRRLWQKPAPATGPTFTTSQSPLVERNMLIAHVGGDAKGALTAFDLNTGNVLWQWDGDGPGYGSPIVAEIAGTRQVITFTFQNLVGVSAATGELLWKRPFRSRADVNSITPLVSGSTVFVSGGDAGVLALNVSKQGPRWVVEDTWKNDETFFQHSNIVRVGDGLFGLAAQGRGRYVVLDAKSGKILWAGEPRAAENAAFQTAGDLLLVLQANGELLVVNGKDRSAFTPLKRYKLSETPTWAAPALSGNRIFVKDLSTVALWTVN